MQTQINFLAAFIVVLALIGLATWLFRRFTGNKLGTNVNRGRMPRLAVVDAAVLGDNRRRLVLVRRDNIEHLLMIGGPNDLLIELNIVRAMPARDGSPPRAPSLTDSPGWNDGDNRPDDLDAMETPPEPVAAPSRRSAPSFADEVRRPIPPPDRRSTEPASLAPDLPSRPEPREPVAPRPPRPPRPDMGQRPPPPRLAETLSRMTRTPEPASPPPPASSSASSLSAATAETEKELTDMAQRLEAALRRPAAPAVNAQSSSSAESSATSPAPAVEPPRPPRPTASAPPVTAPEAPSAPAAPAGGRTGFENLEDEMASLLGRPKAPS